MRAKLEILAMVLGIIGLAGTIAATALPMWRVSAFIGANIIVMEELWEGLWMNCYRQADIKMQCKVYDSLLELPAELQAARGLMCVSIVLVVFSLLITGCGTKKSICCNDNMKSKNITLALGGCLYLLSFLTTLIPVSWVGHTVIRNFYNPNVLDSEKRELGEALFVGWTTSAILLITGIIFLFSYSQRRSKEEEPYADMHVMVARDVSRADSVYLKKSPSSLHKHQEYV
ncbi:claudin-17-like [Thunnus albacares]|uniref:claudin-17-like n=1 Tax=Thunnus maccoyii TaxID=8240 RepID=UPI001C4ACCD7|nr:claudin-17-like [Thunnus maccoyii]XP_044210591.1 claudin-17-like [Thunnus albacares]|eukprot:superscaffoldBa00000001_g22